MSANGNDAAFALRIRGLTVTLPAAADRAAAVRDLDLDVLPGETVCLVGESGSGKSVTALATMGLLPRSLAVQAGSIHVGPARTGSDHGGPIDVLAASAGQLRALRGATMAMVFQEPMTALNPVMRCGEQIDEVLRAHGIHRHDAARRRAIVHETLEHVGLPDPARMARSYPHELSGGQRQRIVIAMALVLRPALLIADEPTTALDVTTQARILDMLGRLRDEHRMGLLLITHDFGVVARMADRVIVMHDGGVVESGPAANVLGAPRHPRTRALIDAVPHGLREPRPSPEPAPVAAALPALEVSGLTRRYGHDIVAASDVALRIGRGQTLGLIGESGSGKSTVARCIVRLIDPDSGRIDVQGIDFATPDQRRLRPHRRLVQIVFQDPYRSLDPRRTAGQSLIEGPMNFGATHAQARERALALLDRVRLPASAFDRLPHEFSGGQRQRLCIARALAMEPVLLVADEAVSALDLTVQAQVLDLLDEIQRDTGLAILFITHDLRIAARRCDVVAVMQAGTIVEQRATRELIERPTHPYTQELLAAVPGLNPEDRISG